MRTAQDRIWWAPAVKFILTSSLETSENREALIILR